MPVTNFVWDELSDNVRMEVDEAGAVTAGYLNEPGQYGNLIAQRRVGINSFYHFDAQGSTRQLTNDSQSETDSYVYSTFGEPVSCTGLTTNPFHYIGAVGYYSNTESNDIYIRRRTYRPRLGRWLSNDPRMFETSFNHYGYVSNQPTIAVDPSGEMLVKGGLTPDDVFSDCFVECMENYDPPETKKYCENWCNIADKKIPHAIVACAFCMALIIADCTAKCLTPKKCILIRRQKLSLPYIRWTRTRMRGNSLQDCCRYGGFSDTGKWVCEGYDGGEIEACFDTNVGTDFPRANFKETKNACPPTIEVMCELWGCDEKKCP